MEGEKIRFRLRGQAVKWSGWEVTVSGLEYKLRPMGHHWRVLIRDMVWFAFSALCVLVQGWLAGSQVEGRAED